MTAGHVLNHVLPAVAGIKPNLTIKVEHRDARFQNERRTRPKRTTRKEVMSSVPREVRTQRAGRNYDTYAIFT
jgi:hypothetical protein